MSKLLQTSTHFHVFLVFCYLGCVCIVLFYLISLLVNVVSVSPVIVIMCPYHTLCSLVSIDVHQCHLYLCYYRTLSFQCLFLSAGLSC